MYCGKCDKAFELCACGGITERMRRLTGPGGHVASRWCCKCDKHYADCKCASPEWRMRCEGKLGPLPGEPGGPETLEDVMKKKRARLN